MYFSLYVSLNMGYGCSKELLNMFWLRNKKSNFQLSTLIWIPENYIQSEIC